MRCIGAPVFDKNDQAVAAISIAGTNEQLSDEKLNRLVRAVKQAAAAGLRAFKRPALKQHNFRARRDSC